MNRFAKILKGEVRKHVAKDLIGSFMWNTLKTCRGSVYLYSPHAAWLLRFHRRPLVHYVRACLLTQEAVKAEGKALS